jgi:hypothetical protein
MFIRQPLVDAFYMGKRGEKAKKPLCITGG